MNWSFVISALKAQQQQICKEISQGKWTREIAHDKMIVADVALVLALALYEGIEPDELPNSA